MRKEVTCSDTIYDGSRKKVTGGGLEGAEKSRYWKRGITRAEDGRGPKLLLGREIAWGGGK